MLYFIHHPSGNVVIRTNNLLIVLQRQKRGCLIAAWLDELLLEHQEWRSSPDLWCTWRDKATELVLCVCGSALASFSPTLTLVPSYTPSGTAGTMSLLNEGAVRAASAPAERVGAVPIGRARDGGSFGNASGSESQGAVPNLALINWITALERKWYRHHGLRALQPG